MGQIRQPEPVKLFASLFAGRVELLDEAIVHLAAEFGSVDFCSDILPFDHTDFYTPEFGPDLVRRFVTFEPLMDPGDLAAVKRRTNEIELLWAVNGRRQVNIDPGYISAGKVVLATTKDHAHRLYLGGGIYAEVTLHYHKGTFEPWSWTYPDYASPGYIALFNDLRQRYMKQLRGSSRH
ncbi:MAG: DUF4416 family protein [Chloroflexi bacterium]|nr:DUF4416 family protein [Chloroflexota bacterium]